MELESGSFAVFVMVMVPFASIGRAEAVKASIVAVRTGLGRNAS